MANLAGYRAVKAEVKRTGWPQLHVGDVTQHTRRDLSRKTAPQAFGFSLRQTGHDLFPADDMFTIEWAEAMTHSGTQQRFYWFDAAAGTAEAEEISLSLLIERLYASVNLTRLRLEAMRLHGLYQQADRAHRRAQTYDTMTGEADARKAWQQACRHVEKIEQARGLKPGEAEEAAPVEA